MDNKIEELWLFDNYVAQEGGHSRTGAITDMIKIFDNKPDNKINDFFIKIFGNDILEKFNVKLFGVFL